MFIMKDSPLISIIVITYNSSKYIQELLDSIMNQCYNKKLIEIIISDDCSKDNTLHICKEWINKNGNKFYGCLFTQTDNNKGIVGNYNHALKFANGGWIKYIAGDDILKSNCISEFIKEIKKDNYKYKIYISGTTPFNEKEVMPDRLLKQKWFEGDSRSQERILVKKGTIIEGPTLFLEKATLIKLGCFDQKYPFIEDYPLYMKYLAKGYPIKYINKSLIYYREHSDSVSRSDNRFSNSIINAIDDYAIPAAKRNYLYLHYYHLILRKAIREKKYNPIILYLLAIFDLVNIKKHFSKIF